MDYILFVKKSEKNAQNGSIIKKLCNPHHIYVISLLDSETYYWHLSFFVINYERNILQNKNTVGNEKSGENSIPLAWKGSSNKHALYSFIVLEPSSKTSRRRRCQR